MLHGLLQNHNSSCVVSGVVGSTLKHAESLSALQTTDDVSWQTRHSTTVMKSTASSERAETVTQTLI